MNTFDDIVLSYDLQLNQFKEELAFDQELLPAEMEYKSVTEREYNHDSFAFYTGDDGTAYSTRANFSTVEQVSNFMLTNYPFRYFHCLDITQECQKVGGLPQYILKAPLYSVKRNTNKDQIEVLTFEQNVRDGKNNILKKAEKGFFNIISTKQYDGYTWYEVEKDRYIAGVNGRVVYLPKEDDENIIEENKRLKRENEDLKKRLSEIKELATYE